MTKIDVLNAKLDLIFKCIQLNSSANKVSDACRFMLNKHLDTYLDLMRKWDGITLDEG